MKKLLGCAIFAAMAMGSPIASAATVNCPGTAVTTDREFTLTTSVASTCLTTGTGNINGNGDAINLLGYLTLDKSDDNTSGLLPNALSAGLTSGLMGSFSFVAPGFSQFVIAFKVGNKHLEPNWAAFLLPSGVTSGEWTVREHELSHVNLYGIRDVSVVPLPSSIWLLLAGLAGLGFMHRRGRARRGSDLMA